MLGTTELEPAAGRDPQRARLTAVVPATDAPPTLARCLAAIAAASDPPDEILVADRPRGEGPAAARNWGARRATGEILAFVDADVVVDEHAFARIRARFDADPRLTAVFGSYDDSPPAGGAVSKFRNLLHHHVHQSSPGSATTFWAGLGAIRRDAFLSAGGFDAERYRVPAVEDIELGMRLAAGGAQIILDPAIQGKHLKRWTLPLMLRTDVLRRGIPWVALLTRTRTGSSVLNLGPRHRAASAAALAVLAGSVARRPRFAAAAVAAFVALNASLYRLLLRRCGLRCAAAGVGLHLLHHLAGVASVGPGVVAGLAESRRRGR